MHLFLNGGGNTDLVNKKFNEVINHDKPILYIPFATDNYKNALEWILNEMKDIHLPIDMVSSGDELVNKDLNNYSAIYVCGGNTYKLLKELKDNNCLDKIINYINNGGIYFGRSAGAVILGYDIDCCKTTDENFCGLTDTKGMNLLDGKSFFAHYNKWNNSSLSLQTNDLINFSKVVGPVIALPEENSLYIHDNDIMLIGNKVLYKIENGNIIEK